MSRAGPIIWPVVVLVLVLGTARGCAHWHSMQQQQQQAETH